MCAIFSRPSISPRIFVLTKGISIVGPRPALPLEAATYNARQKQRLQVKPDITCYWQTRRNRDFIAFDEWVELDLSPLLMGKEAKSYGVLCLKSDGP